MEQLDPLAIQMESLTMEKIQTMQEFLEHSDIVSVIFLLYECPQRAFEDLIVRNTPERHRNLVLDWALTAKRLWTWKWELLEALLICQVFRAIKCLGIHVQTLKAYYASTKISYINPVRKILYQICENMDNATYMKFKRILTTSYNMILIQHESYEILFVQLMCMDVFTVSSYDDSINSTKKMSVQTIIGILEQFHNLQSLCVQLKYVAGIYHCKRTKILLPHDPLEQSSMSHTKSEDNEEVANEDFHDTYELLNELSLVEFVNKKLKSDQNYYVRSWNC